MLEGVAEGYLREGKRFMTIAIGCTGGKHRSVAMTEEIAAPAARRAGTTSAPPTATSGASDVAELRRPVGWSPSAAATACTPRCRRCATLVDD